MFEPYDYICKYFNSKFLPWDGLWICTRGFLFSCRLQAFLYVIIIPTLECFYSNFFRLLCALCALKSKRLRSTILNPSMEKPIQARTSARIFIEWQIMSDISRRALIGHVQNRITLHHSDMSYNQYMCKSISWIKILTSKAEGMK